MSDYLCYQQLVADLITYQQAYYQQQAPLISDTDYDSLFQKLLAIEAAHPDWVLPNSPSQRVGGDRDRLFSAVPHSRPMLSLDNIFSETEWWAFLQKINKLSPAAAESQWVVEPKLDGVAINLRYQHGQLMQAATRGDGQVGEDVTNNLMPISSIPKRIAFVSADWLEVRGEMIMHRQDFNHLNHQLQQAGKKLFANPRNATSGTIRQLAQQAALPRILHFYAYGVGSVPSGLNWSYHTERLAWLTQQGFCLADRWQACSTDQVMPLLMSWEVDRMRWPYEIDGAVLKINSLQASQQLGYTRRAPRWAVAYKFTAAEVCTKLLSVDWQVGRLGNLTPVAKLQPVQLGGVTIQSATLHNQLEIARKQIKLGDWVWIKRAGDVIPAVIAPIYDRRDHHCQPITIPSHCPACGGLIEDIQGLLHCRQGLLCPPQRLARLAHWLSRKALYVQGLGTELLKALIEFQPTITIAGLFQLSHADWMNLPHVGRKKAANIMQALDHSRHVKWSAVIYGMGIPEVGHATAEVLARHFSDWQALRAAQSDELMMLPDIGPVVAQAIYDFTHCPEDVSLIDELLPQLSLRQSIADFSSSLPLSQKKVVVTGSLDAFTRLEAEAALKTLGATVQTQVSRQTDYLLCGEHPGSKRDKSEKLGIPIVDELWLKQLLETITT